MPSYTNFRDKSYNPHFLFSFIIIVENFILQQLRLLTKIYSRKKEAFFRLKQEIQQAISDLDVTITSIIYDDSGFINLRLEGEEEVVASNYLSTLFGKSYRLDELDEGEIIKGYICSSGKVGFGLFVDIGIKEPYATDALIPLFNLRDQLMEGLTVSTSKIINLYGLVDNFPIEITIEKVSIGLKQIEAKLSVDQVALFNRWLDENLEKLYIIGAFEEEIEEALYKTRHRQDVIEIVQLGWMEYALTCKFNTTAKGLIPELGKRLESVRLEIFQPAEIKRYMKERLKKE
ncbi:MAG: DUF2110 family protein [Candidatus Heimdallarchaeota archaeon]|nr:DUF2110 family protein [Candidatus Heimdallarchaeota archaeon]